MTNEEAAKVITADALHDYLTRGSWVTEVSLDQSHEQDIEVGVEKVHDLICGRAHTTAGCTFIDGQRLEAIVRVLYTRAAEAFYATGLSIGRDRERNVS